MSNAWLVGRARELRASVQTSERAEQLRIIDELDVLLQEAKRRGDPLMIADLLRSAALARLATRGRCATSEPLLDELLAHTRRNGMPIHRAGAHALQARRLILAGKQDAAVTEIARALAVLDDPPADDAHAGDRDTERALVRALIDCWQVLSELSLYETAEEVSARSHSALLQSAGPHEITIHLLNFIEMLLAWALRLERVRKKDLARQKFRMAASVAREVEKPFTDSLFRKRDEPAIEQVGLVAAAVAFEKPGQEHVTRLRRLLAQPSSGQETVLVAIALARCLEVDGSRDEAMKVLVAAREEARAMNAPTSTQLNIDRELARIETAGRVAQTVVSYVQSLEAELWALRESQAAALETRRKHERLSAQHGAIAKAALQDPLTGLPNRRALDERLRQLSGDASAQPLAVALIDLDGFKGVNDNKSHQEGDDVLRVIASTLRDALRGGDFVARYGGDEFVVLLPGAPASAAANAMNRCRSAVADLPGHLSHGVTLSVGLVSMAPTENVDEVLSRADAAMYEAKRNGGNQVVSAMQDGAEAVS
ncbi:MULTISPECIES: GGDEF domain-containing protein [Thermocrispum]|jgi:diguanylate cyclase (GGDEF)-like protein|uniref:GGDEF domain-containing protein n=1 Tax=Thermocrispum agreste TaxID=37925 RepID=A0ABD6FHF6_9PSEU|nr:MULTISPECIES: GGDEF domain-containing protein [Thermocrispum]